MAQVTTGPSHVTWAGTYLGILVPGLVVGVLLGLAEHLRRTTADPRGRLLVWSPFAFTGVLVVDLVQHGSTLRGGIGGGAVGLPVFGVAGAYALAGRRRWARVACALLALSPVLIWVLTAPNFGGPSLSITTPKGAWIALYFWSFLTILMVATSIPLRIPPRGWAGPRTALEDPPGVEEPGLRGWAEPAPGGRQMRAGHPFATPVVWTLRLAGLGALVNGAGFGAFDIPAIWHLARYGTVWHALGNPTYGHGRFEAHGFAVSVPVLIAFLGTCLVLAIGGVLLMIPRSTGVVFTLAGIVMCAPFWWGFNLPYAWLNAATILVLLALAWATQMVAPPGGPATAREGVLHD
jgi:hypothetical protein